MKKILVLSLLFALLAVPASAETREEIENMFADRFFAYGIQSFNWKCNEVQNIDMGKFTVGTIATNNFYYIFKVTCENNLTYHVRRTGYAHTTSILFTFCHKGTCKEFK